MMCFRIRRMHIYNLLLQGYCRNSGEYAMINLTVQFGTT